MMSEIDASLAAIRSALRKPLDEVAQFGVCGFRPFKTQLYNRPGVYYVLSITPSLWRSISNAKPFMYHRQLITILRELGKGLDSLGAGTGNASVHHIASEPLALALGTPQQLNEAGIYTTNGHFVVPQPRLEQQLTPNANGTDTIVLSFTPWMVPASDLFFDTENPLHHVWLSFVLLPQSRFPGGVNLELCKRSVERTLLGWSLTSTSPTAHDMVARSLFRLIRPELHSS